MRHQKTRNKLSRDSAHRKALLMNLSKEIIEHERIKTTDTKAKAVKPEIEKLITLAKQGDLHARRRALSTLAQDKFAVHKLFEELAPRYVDRRGGYTRILKLGPRKSDASEMVFIELVCGRSRGRCSAGGWSQSLRSSTTGQGSRDGRVSPASGPSRRSSSGLCARSSAQPAPAGSR
jgi:large subunit ribosomal protein L17